MTENERGIDGPQLPDAAASDASVALGGLQKLAYRMWRSLETKERIIHLQTFKWTFPARDAVAWLVEANEAGSPQDALELCNALLRAGFIKGCMKQETFSGDGDLYRFVSAMAYSNDYLGYSDPNYKSRSLSNKLSASLQQTQFYKEIAKIGKAAAQPFKGMNLDQLTHQLAPTRSGNSGSARTYGEPGDTLLTSAVNKLGRTRSVPGACGEVVPHRSEELEALLQMATGVEALQASLKEQLGLVRLDLQQHTALQEHLVGLLSSIDAHHAHLQLLAAAGAAAVAALLLVVVLQLAHLQGGVGTFTTLAAGAAAGWLAHRHLRPRGTYDSSSSSSSSGSSSVARLLKRQGSGQGSGRDLLPGAAGLVGEGGLHQRGRTTAGNAAASAARATEEEDDAVLSDGEFGDASDDEDEDGAPGGVPCLSEFESHPDSPLLMRVNTQAAGVSFPQLPHPRAPLRLNSAPYPFESELFKGVIAVYVRHLGSTPGHLFRGKKRVTWVVLQGRFKRPVPMDTLVFGQEFGRGFRNLPAPWFIENMLLPLARKISPSLRVGGLDEPHFAVPLVTSSQIVNAALPGQEPGIMDAKEDMRAYDAALSRAGQPLTVAARRKHFQSPKARQRCFSTEHVWTFHLWQEYLDYARYVLALPYSTYDLTQHLDGQPLQIMLKDTAAANAGAAPGGTSSGGGGTSSSGSSGHNSATYMVSLLVWHAGLVRSIASSRAAHGVPRRHTRQQQQQVLLPPPQQQQQGEAVSRPLSPSSTPRQQQQQQQRASAGGAVVVSGNSATSSSMGRLPEGAAGSSSSALKDRPTRNSYHGSGTPSNLGPAGAAARELHHTLSTPLPGSVPAAPQQQWQQQQQQQQQQAAAGYYSSSSGAGDGHWASVASPQQQQLQTIRSGDAGMGPRYMSGPAISSPTAGSKGGSSSSGAVGGMAQPSLVQQHLEAAAARGSRSGSGSFERHAPTAAAGGGAGTGSVGSPLSGRSPRNRATAAATYAGGAAAGGGGSSAAASVADGEVVNGRGASSGMSSPTFNSPFDG